MTKRQDVNAIVTSVLTNYMNGDWSELCAQARKKLLSEDDIKSFAKLAVEMLKENSDKLKTEREFLDFYQVIRNCTLKTADPERQKRREALKEAVKTILNSPNGNWKDLALGLSTKNAAGFYYHFLQYDNSHTKPVEFNPYRFFKQTLPYPQNCPCTVLLGSNFLTSNILKQHQDGSHVLDSAQICYDEKSQVPEIILSVGDGCGGHCRANMYTFGDPKLTVEQKEKMIKDANRDFDYQDKTISRASRFATRECVRLFAIHNTPNSLIENMAYIQWLVSEGIKLKTPEERTTLICVRAFPVFARRQLLYRLIGFNIGDGALVTYDQEKKFLTTLSPSRVAVYQGGQQGTAQLPGYLDYEVHFIDEVVPPQTILILMTDGVYDYLPTIAKEKQYEIKNAQQKGPLNYIEKSIDMKASEEIFLTVSGNITPDQCVDLVTKYIIQKVNIEREKMPLSQESSSETQKGDDLAMLAFCLQNLALKKAYRDENKSRDSCRLL